MAKEHLSANTTGNSSETRFVLALTDVATHTSKTMHAWLHIREVQDILEQPAEYDDIRWL
jgi:hypothetical protein